MDLRTLALLLLPCLPSIGCAGGEQGSASATATADVTTSGESTKTGGASSGSSSSGSATGSTDPTDSTVGTTTLAPGECVDDRHCRDGLLCLDGYCSFCPLAESEERLSATALVQRAGRCSPCGEAVITVPLPAANLVLVADKSASMASESRFEGLDGGVIQAVADAQAEGIATFVIGLGAAEVPAATVIDSEPDGINPSEFLAAVAVAGGGHPDINTSDQAEVNAAVGEVASALIPCTFALDPAPQWPMDVTLKVGDVDYGGAIDDPCGGADGWRYADANFDAVELCGAACTGARVVGEVDIQYLLPHHGAGANPFRKACNQWDADTRFMHGTLVSHSMFAQEHPVVSGKDDQRVVQLARFPQCLVDTSHTVVN